jgi:serine/threonine-protein kinase
VGTPAFTAPERFAGAPTTPATDVYAVGVLLHTCLAGRLPWPVDTLRANPPSYLHLDPEPLPGVDGLPADVADLCRRCLAREPDGRPSSFAVALLLAQTVDAQVYVPVVGMGVPLPRAAAPTPWAERAAAVATDALRAATDVVPPVDARPAGRHRA